MRAVNRYYLFWMKRRGFIIIAIVLSLATTGIYLRAQRRIEKNLSGDEYHQIMMLAGSSWGQISQPFDMQFSGDNALIYPFHKAFGQNKWGLAIPHIISTFLGFYFLFLLCREYFKTICGYIITFSIFAYNYNLIYHAFEIRPYSVIVTLTMVSFLICKYITENQDPPPGIRVLVCMYIYLVSFFHLWTAYSLFFIYIFHLLASRKDKSLRSVLFGNIKHYGVAVILALPLLWAVLSAPDPSWGSTPDTFAFIPKGIVPVIKGVIGNLIGPRRFYILLAGLIISFLIPHRQRAKQIIFFIVLLVVPIALLLLICIIHPYWFIQRHFIWTAPLFAFFLGWCWDSIIVYFWEIFNKNVRHLRKN